MNKDQKELMYTIIIIGSMASIIGFWWNMGIAGPCDLLYDLFFGACKR